MTGQTRRVGAIITWFYPDEAALGGLDDAVRECETVIVVDNTPSGTPSRLGAPSRSAVYVATGVNVGLATAFNIGIRHMPAEVDTFLLLDQDSRMPPGTVTALARHLRPGVAVAAPAPWDDTEGRYLDPRTALRPAVAEMDAVITSGMLVQRDALESVGPFREDFFVDSVDQDLCLRLRRRGWKLVQDRDVRLSHQLGQARWHSIFGVRVRASHHQSWRLYDGARNSTILSREYLRLNPRWATVNAFQLAYWFLTIMAFEPPRQHRALLFLRGVRDGLIGADRADVSGAPPGSPQ